MNISEKGLSLIKHFEGCKLTAYRCPANVLTIGYGHTGGVLEGTTISQEVADYFLKTDMTFFEKAVTEAVKVALNQSQFDALVAFAFNVGKGTPPNHPKGPSGLLGSTLLRKLNSGDYAGATTEFLRWNKAKGKVLTGLTRRRQAEAHLFATGEIKLKF